MPKKPPESAVPEDSSPPESVAADAADPHAGKDGGVCDPPRSPLGLIRCIGPGLIIAGSIVGSGELIATTKTGAEAGFSLLWLILLGCVVKVFAQVELGRYAIISGKPTLRALDEVPGPRWKGRGNWLVWYWVVMWLASISQLGGIVGGVGQALAISAPLTHAGQEYNESADAEVLVRLESYVDRDAGNLPADGSANSLDSAPAENGVGEPEATGDTPVTADDVPEPADAKIWAAVMAILTSFILVYGRYGLIQSLSTVLVASFTVLTVLNLAMLQGQPDWRVSVSEFFSGLQLQLPDGSGDRNPIGTALATFGIIGVGAAELVVYPYWCLEKGYARFTGRSDGSEAWTRRAQGWMRVMRVDAWGAMVLYTFATIAFYLLGAAILNRVHLNPEGESMVRTLAVMFRPVFSQWASTVFLFGAFAVLYSTFFVSNASHARTFTDAMYVTGVIGPDEETQRKWIRILSGVFPILCLVIYLYIPRPAQLVLISGVAQGIMLPMLAGAALYFRYRRCLPGLEPGKLWDLMLWISGLAMLVTGGWTVVIAIQKYLAG